MDKYNRRAVFAMICCAVFVLSLILSMQASSRMVAVLALSFALAFGSPANPAVFTMIQNVIDKEQIASATGFLNGFSYIFASIAPVGMGALYTMTGTLKAGFFGLSGIIIIAFLLCIPLVKQKI
jgi:nitrate/nitrite transporter NarK